MAKTAFQACIAREMKGTRGSQGSIHRKLGAAARACSRKHGHRKHR